MRFWYTSFHLVQYLLFQEIGGERLTDQTDIASLPFRRLAPPNPPPVFPRFALCAFRFIRLSTASRTPIRVIKIWTALAHPNVSLASKANACHLTLYWSGITWHCISMLQILFWSYTVIQPYSHKKQFKFKFNHHEIFTDCTGYTLKWWHSQCHTAVKRIKAI